MMILCKETSSKHVLSANVSRSVKEDFTIVALYSCTTACHSTAALLQTATSILKLHRPFLSARYLSGRVTWTLLGGGVRYIYLAAENSVHP